MKVRITSKTTQASLLELARELECTLDKAVEHLVNTLKGEQPNDKANKKEKEQ